jgi:hypothetical protein
MKRFLGTLMTVFLIVGLTSACAMRQKKVEKELKDPGPVDCSTAQGDLRLLHHEKANVAERMAEGITSIYPAGLVIGVLTRTESTKVKVAIGDYNKAIDKRIAAIQQTCGIQ